MDSVPIYSLRTQLLKVVSILLQPAKVEFAVCSKYFVWRMWKRGGGTTDDGEKIPGVKTLRSIMVIRNRGQKVVRIRDLLKIAIKLC